MTRPEQVRSKDREVKSSVFQTFFSKSSAKDHSLHVSLAAPGTTIIRACAVQKQPTTEAAVISCTSLNRPTSFLAHDNVKKKALKSNSR